MSAVQDHNAHVRAYRKAEHAADEACWAALMARVNTLPPVPAPAIVLPKPACRLHSVYRRDCLKCCGLTVAVGLPSRESTEVKHGKQCLCGPVAKRVNDCDKCGYRGHMCKRCVKWTFGKCRRCA